MNATIDTTSRGAWTLRHPDGRLVSEVLWGADAPVVVLHYPSGENCILYRSRGSWHKAMEEATRHAERRDGFWALEVPRD